jgi:hypothetical protein
MAEPKLTLDEAMALMDKHAAEADAKAAAKKTKKPTTKEKVKDLMLEGAKQGRGGLNTGASRQLKLLEEEGY